MKRAEDIKGFERLTESDQKLFASFWKNYNEAHGIDARANIVPVSIEYRKDSDEKYIRFDFKYYNRKEWLHVKGPHHWF